MIRGVRLSRAASDFPFLGVVMIVLASYAIFTVALPENPARPIVALAAFFSMGYATLALIAGKSIPLSTAEILAFTTGFTILVTAVSALGVSIIGIPITQFAVIIIGLPIAVLTWLLRRPRTKVPDAVVAFFRSYFDFSDYSRAEKGIAAILFALVLIVLAAYVSLSAVYYPDPLSPAIALTGPDGTLDTVNFTVAVGEPRMVNVTVLGAETVGSFDLVIRLVPRNATGSETFTRTTQASPLHLGPFVFYQESLTVGSGGRWSKSYSIVMDEQGLFWLRFELVDSTTIVTRSHLPATVS